MTASHKVPDVETGESVGAGEIVGTGETVGSYESARVGLRKSNNWHMSLYISHVTRLESVSVYQSYLGSKRKRTY